MIDKLPLRLYRVARMTVDGHSRKSIAQALSLTPKAVEKMRSMVYETFDVKDRFELAALVPDAKLKRPHRWPCHAYRVGLSMRHEEVAALNRVHAAIELGRPVDVMIRDPMYRKARGVLLRSMISIQRKLEAKEMP